MPPPLKASMLPCIGLLATQAEPRELRVVARQDQVFSIPLPLGLSFLWMLTAPQVKWCSLAV